MARPTKPKEVKEKPESSGGRIPGFLSGGNLTFLIINLLTSIILAAALIGSNYFILNAMISNLHLGAPATEGESEEGANGQQIDEEPVATAIMELEQKVINLSDTDANRYLRVKVSLDVAPGSAAAPEEAGAHSSGGGGEAPPEDPFAKYRPAILDAIISILSSKTSEELLTLNGKERVKEEIKEAADAIFQGEWVVIRVNFLEFVVQ